MAGVVLRPGEGEVLFGGRIVLKATFDQLCITESFFDSARDGARPHLHHRHADSFYVVEGEFAVLVHDEEHLLTPGGCVCAPPEVVHGFRTATPSRFLNFHTPDGGFAENLRARNRGEEGGFDNVDVEPGSGRPPTDAVLLGRGEGELLNGPNRVATIKIGREELALIEFELEPGFEGPDPHAHDDHVDSFYVLDGEVTFLHGRRDAAPRARLVRGCAARDRARVLESRPRTSPGLERARSQRRLPRTAARVEHVIDRSFQTDARAKPARPDNGRRKRRPQADPRVQHLSRGNHAPRWVNQQPRSSSRKTTAFSPDCSTTSK